MQTLLEFCVHRYLHLSFHLWYISKVLFYSCTLSAFMGLPPAINIGRGDPRENTRKDMWQNIWHKQANTQTLSRAVGYTHPPLRADLERWEVRINYLCNLSQSVRECSQGRTRTHIPRPPEHTRADIRRCWKGKVHSLKQNKMENMW